MLSTIKRLEVIYNSINDSNTFTNGDVIYGEVRLEAEKDFQILSLLIKFKGKAEVLWAERHGQTTHVYHAKDKYFSVRSYFIRDKNSKSKFAFHSALRARRSLLKLEKNKQKTKKNNQKLNYLCSVYSFKEFSKQINSA